MGITERNVAYGAYHREGSVEHKGCLNGTHRIRVGVGYGYRAYVAVTPSSYRSYTTEDSDSLPSLRYVSGSDHPPAYIREGEGGEIVVPMVKEPSAYSGDHCNSRHYQRERGQNVVAGKRLTAYVDGRTDIKPPHSPYQQGGKKHKIPVADQLDARYLAEIHLIAKLTEHAPRRAPQSVAEIYRVREIDQQRQRIDDYEEPFAEPVPTGALFQMHRREHQQHIQGIGIEDARSVEHHSGSKEIPEAPLGNALAEIAPVLKKIFDPGDGIDDEYNQDVCRCRHKRREHRPGGKDITLCFLHVRWRESSRCYFYVAASGIAVLYNTDLCGDTLAHRVGMTDHTHFLPLRRLEHGQGIYHGSQRIGVESAEPLIDKQISE